MLETDDKDGGGGKFGDILLFNFSGD
jgi:hypothetical protein